jgi:FAD/FMN-containing dehydrogenase
MRGVFRRDERARAAYAEAAGIYRIVPSAACRPVDAADLAALVRWAAEHHVPLVPRGAGSAMGGGNVGDGVVVDLTGLPRRLEIVASRRRAITSAAVTAAELGQAADPHGLRLPPDPSSGRWATLGGMVSTNAAGARSVRYGSVRRWVEGVTLIGADGELLTLRREGGNPPALEHALAPVIQAAATLVEARFPRTRKNSSGYALDAFLASGDLLALVIGGEGTLGIVTEIEWRLDPIPRHRAGLRVSLSSLDQLTRAAGVLLSQQPSAVELLDRTFLELVAGSDAAAAARLGDAEVVLLVELERDDSDELHLAVDSAAAGVRPWVAAVDTALSSSAAERLWALRHAASPILAGLPETRRSLQVIEDGCVPVERMGDYSRAVRDAAAARRIAVVIFGHAGDGHIHANLLPELDRAGWESAVAGLLDEVTDALVRLGGTPSGEHGDGRLRAGLLRRVYGDQIMELFRRVKQSFDPLGILNPGIILPAGEPPIARLKTGRSAVSLPDDIAAALREIERTGGYGRCRMEMA